MIIRLGMAPRLPGADLGEFIEHWRTSHGALSAQIPNQRGYVHYYGVLADGRPVFPYPGFDACSLMEFDSLEAMEEGFASETFKQGSAADEVTFIVPSAFSLFLGERTVVVDGEPGADAVVLLTLRRHHPAGSAAELREAFAGPYADAVAATRPLRYEQLLGLDHARTGRQAAACDVVDLRWFPSVDVVEADTGAEHLLAGVALGTERHLAHENRIV